MEFNSFFFFLKFQSIQFLSLKIDRNLVSVVLSNLFMIFLFYGTEDSDMVEMVLLGVSCCVELVRTGGVAVRGCEGCS